MTEDQKELLEKAIFDGEIVTSGIDKTPGLKRRVLKQCLRKGWIKHDMGGGSFDHGGVHHGYKITAEGRKALKCEV